MMNYHWTAANIFIPALTKKEHPTPSPYLTYPYLAASKATAPQQYVSPYPKPHSKEISTQRLNLDPPYLKYPYLAASKAAAPQQYVSPYPKLHPKEVSTQRLNLEGLSTPAALSTALKREASENMGNAPKRMKNETTSAASKQSCSSARSKLSKASGSIHVPSEPSVALSSSRSPRNQAWTSVMLVNFADTLRKSFDFNAFASKHGKPVKDIRDTFEMVVSKPIFEYSSRGMARAKMKAFNQKLKDFVAWTNRGGRDVHGELTTSPWKLSSTEKAKEAERKAKEAESTAKGKKGEKAANAGPSKGKGPATTKRPRALKAPGEPLVYKDGIYR